MCDINKLSDMMQRACMAGMASSGWSNIRWLESFAQSVEVPQPISAAALALWSTGNGVDKKLEEVARDETHRGYHNANLMLFTMSKPTGVLDLEGPDSDMLTFLLNCTVLTIEELGDIYMMGTSLGGSRSEALGLGEVDNDDLDEARKLWMK